MTEMRKAPKDFGFGEEEMMMRDMAHKVLDTRLPTDTLRRLVAEHPEPIYDLGNRPAWDESLWAEIVDLGWTGLAVPEAQGGSDISMVGIAAMLEESGRYALPSPLIPTLSASVVLRLAGGENADGYLENIAGGTSASLATTNERGSWEPADAPLTATRDGDGYVLSGTAFFVQDAFKAQLFVASAAFEDTTLLFVVTPQTEGLITQQDHIHDLTRDQASLLFSDVRVGTDALVSTDGALVLRSAWPRLMAFVAADLCGASEWLLQTTVEYAKERVQFDRPIGFFQAVKHPLVNAMVDIDRARSLLYHACAEIDAGTPQAEAATRMAKSAASDAAAFMSNRAIQLHGGIGFTWEHALHIYFKRNLHNQALFGDGAYQRKKLADVLIGPISGKTQ